MKRILFRILLILMLGATCATIFKFSSEISDKSTKTSSKVINAIINNFKYTKDLSTEKKVKLEGIMQPIIRKTAHFSIYMLIGILIMTFVSTYNITLLRKLVISIGFGMLYAASDEFHQYFVPGRSAEIRDVLIDTSGTILGIIIVLVIISIYKALKSDYKKIEEKE